MVSSQWYVCFCETIRRHKQEKFEFLGSFETKEAAESIQNSARVLLDEHMLAKIAGVDLIAGNQISSFL